MSRFGSFAFVFMILVFLFAGVSARNFTIYNSTNPSQTYFIINGDTGRIGVGTATPQNLFNVLGDGNFTGTLYSNGAEVLTSANFEESEPLWTANYSTFLSHITWSDVMNGTIDTLISEGNVNSSDYLGGYSASFFMPLNTSVYGQFDFNGGWTSNGLSIIDGDIYAQEGYFYKINSLQVANLAVNGSLIPAAGFDNQFDVGNSTLRWRDLTLGRNAVVGGTATITGNLIVHTNDLYVDTATERVGIGTVTPQNLLNVLGDGNFTGAIYSNGAEVLTSDTEADPLWASNFTIYNASWSSTYNSSYEAAYQFVINGTLVPYENAIKNLDLNSKNVTTTGTGFFGFLGSLTSRITGLFVEDVNLSGTLSGDGNISITGNVVAADLEADNDLRVGGQGNFTGNIHSEGNLSIKETLISIDAGGNVNVW